MRELDREELQRWALLGRHFGHIEFRLNSEDFSRLPHQAALRERALRATEKAVEELKCFTAITAETGYLRLAKLACTLFDVNSTLLMIKCTKVDCSPDCFSQELELSETSNN